MPVTTRRQSRSLPQPNPIDGSEREQSEDRLLEIPQEGDEDDPMDGSLAELTSSDDDDDEYEYRSDVLDSEVSEEGSDGEESDNNEFDNHFEVTLPAAKRRKLAKAEEKPRAKPKRSGLGRSVQGRLQNMLSLPLDVLFVVCWHILGTGAHGSPEPRPHEQNLRQVLMSRKSMSVWIAVRRNAGATMVPEPPEDMSEPAWVQLLFGPAVCSSCSAKNVHRVDFALRRRLCNICRKRNLVFSIKFRVQCPGLKESVMDLLPYTRIGGWAHGHISNSRFYWKSDLYEMGNKLSRLEEDIEAGKPGAKKRLKQVSIFQSTRVALTRHQGCAEFEKWVKTEVEAQSHEAYERRMQRREALKNRIIAAGYDIADINYIGIHCVPGSNVDKVLTDDTWRRIRVKVETTLSAAREARLLAVRRIRESEYKNKAEEYYSHVLRQVLPVQRLYLPALSQASELSCFRDLLDLDRDVQPDEWGHAADQLAQSLSEWMSDHRDRYAGLLPTQGTQVKAMEVIFLSNLSIDQRRHGAMLNFAGQLDLVTSVFCAAATNAILIGRDACHAWKLGQRLEFCARGAEATYALLRELELDSASTTVPTLDQLDKYFICASCPLDVARRHSWRSCVLHFVEASDADHAHPQWQIVSPDGVASSLTRRERERSSGAVQYSPPRFESWLCNHCSDYLAPSPPTRFGSCVMMGSKREAVQHVQTEHNIDNPAVDADIFSYSMFAGI
ncbi:hypothetical protein B0F90DRAFT_1820696 [Multifurca ochricompacta]|uniref:Uncharacterized protein n=1 Tax=Multifurca ochricompacta TaxID=376703 RepID=A0AAD4M030_9AGAM|nr:hypothetical protein B0F90DRAFT_1820696 [Multifurca ochricompacta]